MSAPTHSLNHSTRLLRNKFAPRAAVRFEMLASLARSRPRPEERAPQSPRQINVALLGATCFADRPRNLGAVRESKSLPTIEPRCSPRLQSRFQRNGTACQVSS